ncbi:GAF domain-containing sensor histidine kinase [Duganella callida]|nr:HAMP domain-containing sensor histidine kinase [Duganella callida]
MSDSADITAQLHSRTGRAPDYKSENDGLSRLADTLAVRPDHIAQELAEVAMRLTGADSAGISLAETSHGQHQFRWVATAGALERYLNGTIPYDISPCAVVVERDAPLLLRHPDTVFHYIRQLQLPVEELLLVPFHHDGQPAGTVWVVNHAAGKIFDAEDLRVVLSLTRFAAIATQAVGTMNGLRAENRQQEAALATSREEDRRKDHFLATLSHEIRNPLSAIAGATELLSLLNKDADARHRRPIERIERQLAQLRAMVDDLTDLASIKSGHVTLHRQPLVLQDIVTKALETCHVGLQEKHHHLAVHMPPEPIRLEGDGFKLTQVLINLLNNAVKYTPPAGNITLDVALAPARVTLKVCDSGIGIPAELLPRVFDMFMQVPLSDRPRNSGLGIGLALVYQFVGLHQGSISARSDGAGKGSCFTVELPRHTN